MSQFTAWNKMVNFKRRKELKKSLNVFDSCLYCVHFKENKTVTEFWHGVWRRCGLSNQRITQYSICDKYREAKAPISVLEKESV